MSRDGRLSSPTPPPPPDDILNAVRPIAPTLIAIMALAGCSSSAPEPKSEAAPKPAKQIADQSRYFPLKDQGPVATANEHLFDKSFLPPGQIASYKSGKKEYQLFLSRCADPTAAAVYLLDYKNKMPGAKLIPHFGGYLGDDEKVPTFVFTKGQWFAGVRGLPEADADAVAREFAAKLP